MNKQINIFTILPNGIKKEYTVVLTFRNNINNKDYIVYTDNTYDKNNHLKFYASIYDLSKEHSFIKEPTTKEEWDVINKVVNQTIPIKE